MSAARLQSSAPWDRRLPHGLGWPPARVAPTWTEEKLAILACYLHGFALACKSHPSGWYALDIFAGSGLNLSATTGAEIPGSALIAFEAGPPLARRVVLC